MQVVFRDRSRTEKVSIDYPIGHRKRRAEGIPVLLRKFESALRGHFDAGRTERILDACRDAGQFEAMPLHAFLGLFAA